MSWFELCNIGVMALFNISVCAFKNRIFDNLINFGFLDDTKTTIWPSLSLAEVDSSLYFGRVRSWQRGSKWTCLKVFTFDFCLANQIMYTISLFKYPNELFTLFVHHLAGMFQEYQLLCLQKLLEVVRMARRYHHLQKEHQQNCPKRRNWER